MKTTRVTTSAISERKRAFRNGQRRKRRGKIQLRLLSIACFLLFPFFSNAQISITNGLTPDQLVQNILGPGVTASNATLQGSNISQGSFTNGSSTNIGLESGIILSTGNVLNTSGPNNSGSRTTVLGIAGDSLLETLIPGFSTMDATVLEFDFIPQADTISFRYVFASEEYPEWVFSWFNDIFGFFLSGPNPSGGNYVSENIALVPGTTLPVAIDNVNNGSTNTGPCTNCAYYVNNTGGVSIQYDGFTAVLTAWAHVVPCVTYHIKLAIADAGDAAYDSSVFLEENSFSSNAVTVSSITMPAVDTSGAAIEGCSDLHIGFTIANPLPYNLNVPISLSGTAINGTDYTAVPTNIVIPAGSDSTSIVITPLLDGIPEGIETIILQVINSCIEDTFIYYIKDNIPMSLVTSPDTEICSGNTQIWGSVTGGVGPYNYNWSPSGTNDSLITVSPASNTTYTLTVTDVCGSTATGDVEVDVTSINVTAYSDTSICPGDSALLNVIASAGQTPYTYQWGPGSDLSSSTIQNPYASPNTTTNYTVTVTDDNGCIGTDDITVNILPSPNVNLGPDVNICPGDTASLTAHNGITYLWSTGETTASIQVSPSVSTTYYVTVTDGPGCPAIDSITVNLFSIINADAGLDQWLCPGSSVTLSGSGGSSYLWSTGDNTQSISVSPLVNTTYTLTVSSSDGCNNTDTVSVFLHTLPIAAASPNDTICEGDTLTLTASGGDKYIWSTGDLTSNITINPITNTTYTVTATDTSSGCTASANTIITVNPTPAADLGPDIVLCSGDSAQLSVSAGNTYLWSTGSTSNSIWVNPTSTTTYSVTVSGPLGCQAFDDILVTVNPPVVANAGPDQTICPGTSTTVTATGGTAYQWNTGDNTASFLATPIANMTFTITVYDANGCSDTDDIAIYIHNAPNAQIDSNHSICPGSPTSLTASGGSAYSWNTGDSSAIITVAPMTSTTYTVTVTDTNGCTATANGVIDMLPFPNADAGADVSICPGDSSTLTASGGITYVWSTGDSSASISVSPTTNTIYYVTVFSSNGCSSTDSVKVSLYPAPIANAGPDQYICPGSMTTVTGNGGVSYEWSTGDNTQSFVASPIATTTFTLTITDINGCIASDSVVINLLPKPTADAGIDQSICEGDSVLLTATGGTGYLWSTGDNTANILISPAVTTTYSVTVTDTNGCTDNDEVVVTVIPAPIANAGPDVDICDGASTLLNASGGVTYAWSTGLNMQNITVAPTSTTTYTVTVTNSNGCTSEDEVVVHWHPIPTADAGADQTICDGSSIILSANGGQDYAWSTGDSTQNITVSPGTHTLYTVTVTSPYGCTATDEVSIYVVPMPVANAGPDQDICQGDSIQINATGGNAFVWSTGDTVSTITVSPSLTSTYTVTVLNSTNCYDTDEVIVNVRAAPGVDCGPDTTMVCFGSNITLNANSATAGCSYLWSSGHNTPTITISPTSTSLYSVTATSPNGCSSTDEVRVIVLPTSFANAGLDQTICEDDSATIMANGGVAYQWSTGALTQSITVSPATTTTYTVIVTSPEGCTSTDQVIVNVNPLPAISAGIDQHICLGNSISLDATGTGNFVWSTGETSNQINVSPQNTTTYNVTATSPFGCTNTDEVIVNVHNAPSLNIAISNASCFDFCDGSIQVNISNPGPGVQYNWSPSGIAGSTPNVNGLCAGSYGLQLTNSYGCVVDTMLSITQPMPLIIDDSITDINCFGSNDGQIETFVSGGTAPYTYQWSNGLGTTSTITNVYAGTYTITVSDSNGCTATAQYTVDQSPEIILQTSADDSICVGQTSVLQASASGGTGPLTLIWDNNLGNGGVHNVQPIVTTSYTVYAVDSLGCVSSPYSITIYVNPPLNVQLNTNSQSICEGEKVSITAQASGGDGNYVYSWSNGTIGSSNQISIVPLTSMWVYVTVTDGCSSAATVDSIEITVNPNPVVIFSALNPEACENNIVQFMDGTMPTGAQYSWNFGDPNSGNDNTSNIQNPDHLYTTPGTYDISLTVTTAAGCTGSYTIPDMITIHPNPTAHFNYHIRTDEFGINTVDFYDQSVGADSWLWTFGDPGSGNNSSADQNPSHTYLNEGTYEVWMWVTSPYGCVDSTAAVFDINGQYDIYFPNAFSPNGDGRNDQFGPKGIGISEFEMYIYDRWGKLVFETHDVQTHWDGSIDGEVEAASQGVYSWVSFVKDEAGTKRKYVGSVTLIR